jgi:hypothetical protein
VSFSRLPPDVLRCPPSRALRRFFLLLSEARRRGLFHSRWPPRRIRESRSGRASSRRPASRLRWRGRPVLARSRGTPWHPLSRAVRDFAGKAQQLSVFAHRGRWTDGLRAHRAGPFGSLQPGLPDRVLSGLWPSRPGTPQSSKEHSPRFASKPLRAPPPPTVDDRGREVAGPPLRRRQRGGRSQLPASGARQVSVGLDGSAALLLASPRPSKGVGSTAPFHGKPCCSLEASASGAGEGSFMRPVGDLRGVGSPFEPWDLTYSAAQLLPKFGRVDPATLWSFEPLIVFSFNTLPTSEACSEPPEASRATRTLPLCSSWLRSTPTATPKRPLTY